MLNLKSKIIIAIDGYSSCGKSTLAKELAKELNYAYVDTGAMYRAVTLYCMNNNLIENKIVKTDLLEKFLNQITITFKYNITLERSDTFLNDLNVENRIRELDVSDNVSIISKIGFVRKKMVILQKEMGKNKGLVMDGRDIGTVVFPEAELKFFMIADPEIRAKRRYKELLEKGDKISFEEVFNNVKQRDYLDENRAESPLKKALDSIILDNTCVTQDEQLKRVIDIINEKFGR
ncbi:MAG: cytidylate kinase [Bacteroidetes bacterium GWA2_30_7]|nr:MAG: cytidylate kinase [Bacteroidetes bacterium GWA2_30_7]